MAKLIQIIIFWKEKHSFEEKLTKLSEYFDNSPISAFLKSQHLFQLEKRCKELFKEKKEDFQENSNQKS